MPPGDVDDAVQEVFVVLHRRMGELDTGNALHGWLRSVAVRICSNQRRNRRRRPSPDRAGEPLDPDALCDVNHPGPDDARARSELRDALRHVLGSLDHEKREVFVLTELEERTAREVATLTRTCPNTVASRLRAARRKLAHAVRAGPLNSFPE
ncbi:MAG TPA: sigma-70 family RNA polymerase sigma factor [Polyangiaceae bacterium]